MLSWIKARVGRSDGPRRLQESQPAGLVRHSSSDDVQQLLDESYGKYLKRPYVLVAIAIGILTFFHIFAAANYNLSNIASAIFSPGSAQLITASAISFSLSILAAIVYSRREDTNLKRLVGRIRELAPADLTSTLMKYVADFDNRHMANYHLRITLSPLPGRQDVMQCRLEYDYQKILAFRHLDFELLRIREDGQTTVESPQSEDVYKKHEFFFCINETSVPSDIQSDESLYEISNLRIDNQPVSMTPKNSSKVHLTAEVPANAVLDAPLNVAYTVSYPVEIDSYVSAVLELPCRNTTVTMDYGQVLDRISVGSVESMSPKKGFYSAHDNKRGIITISHNSWAVPRSGITFIWFSKAK